MLRLDLTAEPRWLDLGHGVRLRVAPLTTALMVAARSDPAVEALPDPPPTRSGRWPSPRRSPGARSPIGRASATPTATPCRSHPRGSMRCSRSGRSSRRSRRPTSRRACCWMRKKTPPRPRRLALRRGRPLLRGLRASVPGLPGAAEPAGDLRGLAGLGPRTAPRRPAPGHPRRGDRLGPRRGAGARGRARHRADGRGRAAAGDRGGDGPPAQRGDRAPMRDGISHQSANPATHIQIATIRASPALLAGRSFEPCCGRPILLHQRLRHQMHGQQDAERQQDQVVEIAEDRHEVRNEVDG